MVYTMLLCVLVFDLFWFVEISVKQNNGRFDTTKCMLLSHSTRQRKRTAQSTHDGSIVEQPAHKMQFGLLAIYDRSCVVSQGAGCVCLGDCSAGCYDGVFSVDVSCETAKKR